MEDAASATIVQQLCILKSDVEGVDSRINAIQFSVA